MKLIYTGEIKKIYVKNIDFSNNGSISEIELSQITVVKEAKFYKNFLGKIISFKYDSLLPTEEEAKIYATNIISSHPTKIEEAECIFVDYDNLTPDAITKEEFKQLKKQYKKGNN